MKKPYQLLLLILCFSGCVNKIGTYSARINDNIDAAVRSEMKYIDEHVLSALQTNDYKKLDSIMSDTLRSKSKTELEQDLLPKLSTYLQGKTISQFQQIHAITSNSAAVIMNFGEGDTAYKFEMIPVTNNTYISLYTITDGNNTTMLTLVYGHNNDKWRLYILKLENYAIKEKNAPALYKTAQMMQARGHLIDAICTMELCSDCSHPVGPFLTYNNGYKMKKFAEAIRDKAAKMYPMPYTLTDVRTKPSVINIRYQLLSGHPMLLVSYVSALDIRDTITLKVENDEIQDKITNTFPGLEENNEWILYKAFDKVPDGKSVPWNYQFVGRNNPSTKRSLPKKK